MALSDRAAAVGPYAQQLLTNQDVQAKARQAADSTRAAYRRARGQDVREAVQDRKLRRRVTAAVAATGKLFGAVSESAPEQKSPWPRRMALLAAVATGAWLLSNQAARARIQGLVGSKGTDDETKPSTDDETKPSTDGEAKPSTDDQTNPLGKEA